MRRTWFRRALMLLAAAGLLAVIVWAFLPRPVEVDLAAVTRGTMMVTVDEDGRTRIRERYVVSAPLTGRLQRIALKAGDAVTVNETIVAVIEPVDPALLDVRARAEAEARVLAAEAAVSHAEANLERATAAFGHAETEHRRRADAFARGGATQHELDTAVILERMTFAEARAARFARQIADFELELARSALLRTRPDGASERLEIRAPIAGRVLRVFQESAAVVAPGTGLLELGDPADIELVIDVLSTDAVRIRPGQRILIEHWGGEGTLIGTVRLVEPSAFTKISALGVEEQRVNVVGDLVDPLERRRTLGDGYRIEARIVVWQAEDVLRVPGGALFRRDGAWTVFAVRAGRAALQHVNVGHQNGTEAELLSGLEENEQVVMYPSDRVRDGVAMRER